MPRSDVSVAAPAPHSSAELERRYLGDFPTIAGNTAQLLVDGENAYPAMLDAIAQAERSIVLESYIFRADQAGARFVEALAARARDGVAIRVLVDGVGSADSPASFWAPLREAGGERAVFHPLSALMPWGDRLWKRDHRKIMVVDDRVAFVGGLNIGNDYAPAAWGGQGWHDVQVRLAGPIARALTHVNRTWLKVTGADWSGRLEPASSVGDTSMQVLEGRLTRRHSVRQAYLHAIRHARHTIRIVNAYCIPDRGVRRALRSACMRGVRVQLLLAGRTDLRSVQYASRHLYARLMRWGVEIYEWTERVLHAKAAVIDGLWCSIGSYNLDRRSLLHNLEANVACVDAGLGSAFDARFEADLRLSHRIDAETWHRRQPLEVLLEMLFYSMRWLL